MILVSAGHNPSDPGACFEGYCEYPEADLWTDTLLFELDKIGIEAAKVPTGFLQHKVAFINKSDAELAIEIHFNADGWSRGNGCETLRYPKSTKGAIMGGVIQLAMSMVMGKDRGLIDGYYQLDSTKGIDYFLKRTRCTALILEPEFIHNKKTIQSKRQECCHAIAHALQGLF